MNLVTFMPVGASAQITLPPSLRLSALPARSQSTAALSNQSTAAQSSQSASVSSTTASSGARSTASASPSRPAMADVGAGLSTASLAQLESAESFSITVAGKQYSGSIEESDGEYTASVPNVFGATATGPSQMAAEINLDAHIDVLA